MDRKKANRLLQAAKAATEAGIELAAEVKRLRAEVESLRAEVERLRAELATIRAPAERPMIPGDRVHLTPIGGGEPSVVEYHGHIRGYAVVAVADRAPFMVSSERVSAIPPKVEAQALPQGCP